MYVCMYEFMYVCMNLCMYVCMSSYCAAGGAAYLCSMLPRATYALCYVEQRVLYAMYASRNVCCMLRMLH